MPTSSENRCSEIPVNLARMTYLEVADFFALCRKRLAAQSILSEESVEQVFGQDFANEFELAPRSLRKHWRTQSNIWSKISKSLLKAEELSEKLSPLEKSINIFELDHLLIARKGSEEALKRADEFALLVSSSNGNPQATLVALAVAKAFQIQGQPITFGRKPDSKNPSTDFGRAVKLAIAIFRPEGNSGKVADWIAPTQAAIKLVKSAKKDIRTLDF